MIFSLCNNLQAAGWHYKKTTLEGKKEPSSGARRRSSKWTALATHIKPMEGQKAERNGIDGEAAWKLEMEADWNSNCSSDIVRDSRMSNNGTRK